MTRRRESAAYIEQLESRRLLSASFGDGVTGPVVFTDGDGTVVSLALRGGMGTVDFGGTDITSVNTGHGVRYSGTAMYLSGITVDNATNAVLVIAARGGNGLVDVPNVTVHGSLALMSANAGNLTGAVTVTDMAHTIVVGTINGGAINVGGIQLDNLIVRGSANDAQVVTPNEIGLIRAAAWTDSDGTRSSITARTINKLVIARGFNADLNLGTGGLYGDSELNNLELMQARIGSIDGGTWSLEGGMYNVATASTAAGWSANVGGDIYFLTVGALSGTISADTAHFIRAGRVDGATMSFLSPDDRSPTLALKSLVAGSVNNSHVWTNGNIGRIVAGSVSGSVFATGVGSAQAYDSTSQFNNDTYITLFRTRAFSDSTLIGPFLGDVLLGAVHDVAGTLPFYGVTAFNARSIRLALEGHAVAARIVNRQYVADTAFFIGRYSPAFFKMKIIQAPAYNSGGGQIFIDVATSYSDLTSSTSGTAVLKGVTGFNGVPLLKIGGSDSGPTGTSTTGGYAAEYFYGPFSAGTIRTYYDEDTQSLARTETNEGYTYNNIFATYTMRIDTPGASGTSTEIQHWAESWELGLQLRDTTLSAPGGAVTDTKTYDVGDAFYPPIVEGGLTYTNHYTLTDQPTGGVRTVSSVTTSIVMSVVPDPVTVFGVTYTNCFAFDRTIATLLPGGRHDTVTQHFIVSTAGGPGMIRMVTGGTNADGTPKPTTTVGLKSIVLPPPDLSDL